MALTGFDPDLVSSSIDKIQSAYDELIRAIGDDTQNQFINGMQDKWACSKAVETFEGFKKNIDHLIFLSNETFESVVKSMNSAAVAWADETGSTWIGKSFSRNDKKLDVSGIQENIAGVRGADPEATAVSAKLTSIIASANSALSNAQAAVQNCGFIGGNSAETLISTLEGIKKYTNAEFTGMAETCKVEIEKTAQDYKDLEVRVSDAFAGNSKNY